MKAGTSSRLLPDNLTFSKLGECWTKKRLWTLPVGMAQKVSQPPRDVTVSPLDIQPIPTKRSPLSCSGSQGFGDHAPRSPGLFTERRPCEASLHCGLCLCSPGSRLLPWAPAAPALQVLGTPHDPGNLRKVVSSKEILWPRPLGPPPG